VYRVYRVRGAISDLLVLWDLVVLLDPAVTREIWDRWDFLVTTVQLVLPAILELSV